MTMLPFGEVAPIKRRVVAYIIDALIAAVLPLIAVIVITIMTVNALSGSGSAGALITATLIIYPLVGVLMLAWFGVYTWMQTKDGSIGMRLQGLRLASATDGAPVSFGRALLRNVVWGLAGSIVVGMFSPLFDGSGRFQGWHDKVGDSVMLDARTSPAPASKTSVEGSAAAVATPSSAAGRPPGFPQPSGFPQGSGFPQASQFPNGSQFPRPAGFPQAGPAAPADVQPQPAAPAPMSFAPVDAPASDVPEETVLSPRLNQAQAQTPEPAAEPRIANMPDDPLISFVPGVTQPPAARPEITPEPAPVAPPAPTRPPTPALPEPPLTSDADDDDIESTRISIPGHRLVFTWDDGQRVTVSRRTVFGRNPADEPGAVSVAVRDETLSLSKTHFEAAAMPSGGWVMDRQSTNGTTIVRDGASIACPPGQRVPVKLGDAIRIGDRIVTIGGFA